MDFMRILRYGTAVAVGLAALTVLAQAPSAGPRFEVASIRPRGPGPELDNPSFLAYRAGQVKSFCSTCISGVHYDNYGAWLKVLIGTAYSIDPRLVDGPDWLNQTEGTNFVIHAVMPQGATREQIPAMIKALLEERFHLVAHRASAEQSAYALVVGKNGPKLKVPREMDRSMCEPWVTSNIALADGTNSEICRTSRDEGDRTVTVMMSSNTGAGPLLTESWRDDSFQYHREHFRITMSQLAKNLEGELSTGSPGMPRAGTVAKVVDRTGIEGAFDVVIDETSGDLAAATIGASLEKQGLRLEKTMVPAEKIVVDRLDKVPTEN